MQAKKPIILTAIIVAALLFLSVPQSFAGGGPEPPGSDALILDVEIWGVFTLIVPSGPCEPTWPAPGNTYAIARVKRIVGCDVFVETKAIHNFGVCSPDPADYMIQIKDLNLVGIQFFDIDPGATAYIDNVKNFDQVTAGNGDTVTTFDAKIKFWK